MVQKLVITDVDNTLLGDKEGLRVLLKALGKHEKWIGLGIATGRRLDSAVSILKKWRAPAPDIWITAVGSEIHYGESRSMDKVWRNHINHRWEPDKIRKVLKKTKGLSMQPKSEQRDHKISYFVDSEKAPGRREIVRLMREHKLAVQVIYSHDMFLDILPLRASKGHAVRYLAMKWGLELDNILVAGDSGNDEEMLLTKTKGVVVGNHSDELAHLKGRDNIYFAKQQYALGILEGIEYYDFMSADD